MSKKSLILREVEQVKLSQWQVCVVKYQGVDPLSKQSHFNYKDRKEVLDFTSNRKKLLEREQIELEKMKEHQLQMIQEKQKGTPPIGQKYKHSQLGKSNEADSEGEAGVEADENSFTAFSGIV